MLSALSTPGTSQALANYRRQSQRWEESAERLTTGKRINHAKDDPSGIQAVAILRMEVANFNGQLKGLKAGEQQAQIQESAYSAAQDVLVGLHDLIGAAANGLPSDQLEMLQNEVDETVTALKRLDLAGRGGGIADALAELQSGGSASLSGDLSKASALVEQAASGLSSRRAALAAYQRATVKPMSDLLQDQVIIHTEAISQIEDTDYAVEAPRFVEAKTLLDATLLTMGIRQKQWAESIQDLLKQAADEQHALTPDATPTAPAQ